MASAYIWYIWYIWYIYYILLSLNFPILLFILVKVSKVIGFVGVLEYSI